MIAVPQERMLPSWGHDGPVSTRTLIVLAAACAVAILAASAIQVLLAR
jgi:hypothetical protein